ncbi:unnamed protein product [Phytomonas sp. EM1]|nr:unnamed protein product [Phytomonas sp. EM1]|eukprot:CCW61739.1 unnamed protein product [Phytomonas sp. isolate EM1]
MSAGYIISTVIFFVAAFPVCLLVYRYYTKVSIRKMNIYCIGCHIITLYTCMVPFPLLTLDVDSALSVHSNPNQGKETWMQVIWIIIFAISYTFGWIILPIAEAYTDVGDFTVKKAIVHSIKVNLRLYSIAVSIILVLFIYIMIAKGLYISTSSILSLAISLANAWGLFMLIIFMPAGLVGVPRTLWRYANPRKMLYSILLRIMDIQEELDFASMDLASIKAELIDIDPLVMDENRPHLQQMLESICEADREIPLYHTAAQRIRPQPATRGRTDVSLQHLEDLNERLKYSIKMVNRANYRWESAVRTCNSLDLIIRGVSNTNNPIKKAWMRIRRYVYLTGCGITTILTVLILWSELVLPFRELTSKPLGVIELLMHSDIHFIISIILLFYMAYCAYWTVFRFKVFNTYTIYPGIADNSSLCFNETFLIRLLMPLSFNFLLISGLSNPDTGVDVMYGHVYRRNMDVSVLLGKGVNQFFPLLIPFVAAVVFFNLMGRILNIVGVEVYHLGDIEGSEMRQRLIDGRKLVEAELGYALAGAGLPGEETTMNGVNGSSRAGDTASHENDGSNVRGKRYREYLEKRGTIQPERGNENASV